MCFCGQEGKSLSSLKAANVTYDWPTVPQQLSRSGDSGPPVTPTVLVESQR